MLIDLHLHTSTKWIFPHYIGISRPFHLPRNSIKLPITELQCLRLRTTSSDGTSIEPRTHTRAPKI